MYDVNPVGPLMHLKELERQATQTFHLDRKVETETAYDACVAMLLFLRRIFHFRGQQAQGSKASHAENTATARS